MCHCYGGGHCITADHILPLPFLVGWFSLCGIFFIRMPGPKKNCNFTCYVNIHEHTRTALGSRPNSTCKAFNPEYWHQALASHRFQCKARQITSGSPLWRDLTKIISILDWRSWDRHVSAGKWTWAIAVGGVHSSKELFEQRINMYSVHLLELTTAPFLLWGQKLSHSYINNT